jgi:tetratricopeptide (TPR) repeat protein
MADACFFWGRFTDLLEYNDRFLEIDPPPEIGIETYGVSLAGIVHLFQGTALGFTGEFQDADRAYERGHAIARDLNMQELDCWLYGNAAATSLLAGEPERAMERARRAGEAARAAGDPPHLLGMEQRSLCHAHTSAGDGRAAREAAESYLRVLGEAGTERAMQAEAPAMIAASTLLSGDVEEAVVAARHGISAAEEMGRLEAETVAQFTLARALVARAETAHDPAIEAAIARIEWLIEESGASFYRAELCELRGQVAAARGESGAAAALYEEARQLYVELNAPRRAAQVG